MNEKYLECGKIVGTHGVRGAVRMTSLCDSAEVLASLRRMYKKTASGFREYKVREAFVHKAAAIVSFDEVTDLDGAMLLKDTVMYADRDDIPLEEGSYFISDLIGLSVTDNENGEVYGTLSEVISPAGRDIYVVKKPDGGEFMIPCVPEFIIRIAPDEKAVYVRLIDGMLN